MTKEQIASLARWLLTVIGGTTAGAAIFTKLGLDPSQFPAFVDALLAAGTALVAVWGFFSHSQKAQVAAAAKTVPIPAAAQMSVGIPASQIVTVTTPPLPSASAVKGK